MLRDLKRILMETHSLDAAVLDLRFSEDPAHIDCFAIATSKGTVDLYGLCQYDVEKLRSFTICDPSILVLSLSWKYWDTDDPVIALSLSDGRIAKLSFDAYRQTVQFADAHSLEAWTTAWSSDAKGRHGNIHSGGDDSALCRRSGSTRYWSQTACAETPGSPNEDEQPLCDMKTHGAGVTAILPLSDPRWGEQIVVTGSYDEHVRVLSIANAKPRSKVLAELNLHGGVWRLKAFGEQKDLTRHEGKFNLKVVASCMHAGTRILQFQRSADGKWSIEILAQFLEHKSMNYASDARSSWAVLEGTLGEVSEVEGTTVISSSFYDKKLCLWSIPNDEDDNDED